MTDVLACLGWRRRDSCFACVRRQDASGVWMMCAFDVSTSGTDDGCEGGEPDDALDALVVTEGAATKSVVNVEAGYIHGWLCYAC